MWTSFLVVMPCLTAVVTLIVISKPTAKREERKGVMSFNSFHLSQKYNYCLELVVYGFSVYLEYDIFI